MADNTTKKPASKIWIAVIVVLLILGVLAGLLVRSRKGAGTTSGDASSGKSPTVLTKKKDWVSPATGMEFVWVSELRMWVGKYEVTNCEFRKKKPDHDSRDYKGHRLNGERQPAVYVNFDDARSLAEWMTQQDRESGRLPSGYMYRLPTDSEWQAFAQCGDGRAYPWGNDWPPTSGQAGNYDDEAIFDSARVEGNYEDGFSVTCEVEKSWKNPLGLYGVGGNVWEATTKDPSGSQFSDWRGASWFVSLPGTMRCDYRLTSGGTDRYSDYGFRLVLARVEKK